MTTPPSTVGSQFSVGVALWEPRRQHRAEDAKPLAEKRGAPTHTITTFEFLESGDNFQNLDSLIIRDRPQFAFLNPRVPPTVAAKMKELLERGGASPVTPCR